MRSYFSIVPYLLLALSIIALDFFFKQSTLDYALIKQFPLAQIDLWGVVIRWDFATNTGIAWGLAADYSSLLLCLRLFFLLLWCFVPYVLSTLLHKESHRPYLFIWALVLGGGTGNVLDMLLRGYVIDFISVSFWGWQYPLFNVADCAICASFVLFLFTKEAGTFSLALSTQEKRAMISDSNRVKSVYKGECDE